MKSFNSVNFRRFFLVFLMSFIQVALWAQDSTGSSSVTTHTTTTTTTWYMQPWVWVVGGAVLLIILVALFRGNSTNTKEVSKTTVIKDKDYR